MLKSSLKVLSKYNGSQEKNRKKFEYLMRRASLFSRKNEEYGLEVRNNVDAICDS